MENSCPHEKTSPDNFVLTRTRFFSSGCSLSKATNPKKTGLYSQWGWGIDDWSTLTEICNQIDRFTPRLSDMIGTIYMLKYLWSIKLMFCESKSRSQRDLDLTFRVESVSHSNCVVIQKDHVLFGALWEHFRSSGSLYFDWLLNRI